MCSTFDGIMSSVGSEPAEEEESIILTETDKLDSILDQIGFEVSDDRDLLHDEGLSSLNDFNRLKEKQLQNMSDALAKRQGDRQLIIGMVRLQSLIGVMHWVHDHRRVDKVIDHETFSTDDVDIALERHEERESFKDQSETMMKSTDPGKLKNASQWIDWYEAFLNLLSVIPSVDGFPLSYVVREDESAATNKEYDDFMDECVAKAPLTGNRFVTDKKRVHKLIKAYTQGESSEQHIAHLSDKNDGRLDMIALRRFYGGSGNVSCQISKADRYKNTLHYKNERYMKFEIFIDKLKEMFNIYAKHSEAMTESAKIRLLLEKIQAPHMSIAVATIRTKIELDSDVDYQHVVNYLASQAAIKYDSNPNRNISYIGTGRGRGRGGRGQRGGRGRGRRAGRGGSTYIPPEKWSTMTPQERQAHIESRTANKDNANKRNIQQVVAESVAEALHAAHEQQDPHSMVGTTVSALTNPDPNSNNDASSQFSGRASQASLKKAIMDKLSKKPKPN